METGYDPAERLALMLPGSHTPIAPTRWSSGQLASLVGAPAGKVRLSKFAKRRRVGNGSGFGPEHRQ